MKIDDMTREDFGKLPHRKWDETITCESIVILPTRRKHDSGYRCLDFVAVVKNEAVCLLSGVSDVIHIDGIGGYGYEFPSLVPPSGWSIYCLPKSGLLRIWPMSQKIICGVALSSFEVFSIGGRKE
jgi:hypothetical protein